MLARSLARTGALALLVPSLALAAAPQQEFVEHNVKDYLPVRFDATAAVLLVDVDADGDLDLLKGGSSFGTPPADRLLANDGTGRFTDVAGALPGSGAVDMAFADVDGDGDGDLVTTDGTSVFLYRNDGAGSFADVSATALPSLATSGFFLCVAVVDVEGDGDPDIVVGTSKAAFELLNDGTGTFTDVSAARMPAATEYTYAFLPGDVDADGDQDLLLVRGSQHLLLLNDGSGTFTDATATHLPSVGGSFAGAVADVDGDGDLDAVFGGSNVASTLLLNDGTGTFTSAPSKMPAEAARAYGVALTDLDGDGDPDLVVTNDLGGFNPHPSRLWRNDGQGGFLTQIQLTQRQDETRSLAVGDVDGDGDTDLVLGNGLTGGQDRLFLNGGAADLVDATRPRVPGRYWGASCGTAADVDGDGDQDLLLGTGRYYSFFCGTTPCDLPVVELVNEGPGVLTDVSAARLPAEPSNNATALGAGDVDGDGDVDLVVGNTRLIFSCGYGGATCTESVPTRLYLNDGTGKYADQSARLPDDPLSNDTTGVFVVDTDGDGDQDVLLGVSGDRTRQYVNEGAGVFSDATPIRMPGTSYATSRILPVDVDGDGDLDLVLGNVNEPSGLLLNDGAGFYTDVGMARMPAMSVDTRALAAGDFDLDGDQDLVLAKTGAPALFLNDGSGRYLDFSERMPSLPGTSDSIATSDVDGDGDPDVLAGVPGEPIHLLVGDGTARFTDQTQTRMPKTPVGTLGFLVADVDGDGDADLYAGDDEGDRLFLNLDRQLSSPRFPIVGREYELEFDAAPGYGTSPRIAVAAFSLQQAIPPLVLSSLEGSLHLLPPVTTFPPVLVPSPAGAASVHQLVPPDPGLVGTRFTTQGVFLEGGHRLRLSGYVAEEIRP